MRLWGTAELGAGLTFLAFGQRIVRRKDGTVEGVATYHEADVPTARETQAITKARCLCISFPIEWNLNSLDFSSTESLKMFVF